MFPTIKKFSDMTEEEFLWMVGQKIDSGEIESWKSINDQINKELGIEEDKWRDESAFRKRYQAAKKFKENCFDKMKYQDDVEELQAMKETIYKEKKKYYDQRREYNKILARDARFEHLMDELVDIAKDMNTNLPLLSDKYYYCDNVSREGLVCFSDWHYGMKTNNVWNEFNTDICKSRVEKTVDYMSKYIIEQGIENLHVVLLGDFAHGACHVTARIKSEEDTCDQLMHVSEILAEAINELSQYVNHVSVYSCYGNHMRTVQKKKDSINSDNMEKIIPWWLKQRLVNNKKVEIFESEYKEFTRLDILGHHICCVHGDNKNFKDIGVITNNIFSKKYNTTIDFTISGDKHHLEEFEQYGIESILVRSLCGTDDYANDRCLYGKAGQTFIVFNKEGRECTYHIPLD